MSSPENESGEDNILRRHRQERKDLQAKIQALKKSVPKGDKKKKREVQDVIGQLEKELDDKHSLELRVISVTDCDTPVLENQDFSIQNDEIAAEPTKILRAQQKRRNKKQDDDKEHVLEQDEANNQERTVLEIEVCKEDLHATIQVSKKLSLKGDNKREKEMQGTIAQLEKELNDKHNLVPEDQHFPIENDEEDVLKQELEENLQAKIQALKKSIPKGDKKKKKEIQDTIAQLERELESKYNCDEPVLDNEDLIQNDVKMDIEATKVTRVEKIRNKAQEENMEGNEYIIEQGDPNAPMLLETNKEDLRMKIQALKKTVSKSDKKRRKEIQEIIAQLEKELDNEQNLQLQATSVTNCDKSVLEDQDFPIQSADMVTTEPAKITRAQRRRNKKQEEEKEREKRILEQDEVNKQGPRNLEMQAIKEILLSNDLDIFNIPADGNCLYCAINHQLETTGREASTVGRLRKQTADFIRQNKDEFLPFMYNDSDTPLDDKQFENYCKEVEKTKLWGGQLELRALSNVLKCPIKVIQASGPSTVQGENFQGAPLILTYHRHLYRLGEHYNSTACKGISENNA